jgi:hypothetical protein
LEYTLDILGVLSASALLNRRSTLLEYTPDIFGVLSLTLRSALVTSFWNFVKLRFPWLAFQCGENMFLASFWNFYYFLEFLPCYPYHLRSLISPGVIHQFLSKIAWIICMLLLAAPFKWHEFWSRRSRDIRPKIWRLHPFAMNCDFSISFSSIDLKSG